MRTLLALAILVVVAVPALAQVPQLQLTYDTVTVSGDWRSSAQLAVIEFAPKKSMTNPSDLHLQATKLHVDIFHDATVYAPTGITKSEAAAEESKDYVDATVSAEHLDADHYVAIMARQDLPAPNVTLVGQCVQAKVAQERTWTPTAFALPREGFDVSTLIAHAMDLQECGAIQAVRVEGDFVLTDYKWSHNITGKNPDGAAQRDTVDSGFTSANDPTNSGVVGRTTQAYFFVTGGVLEFFPGQAEAPVLALAQPRFEGRDLQLHGTPLDAVAAGTTAKAPNGDYQATGSNTLAFAWKSDSAFAVHVMGDACPSGLATNSVVAFRVRRDVALAWAAGSAAVVLGALALTTRWVRPWMEPEDILDRGHVYYRDGHYYRTYWFARLANWRGGLPGPTCNLVAHAQGSLNKTESCLRWFARAIQGYTSPEDVARTHYLAAVFAARGGYADQSADNLARAAEFDPAYLQEAQAGRDFEQVKEHPAFQDLLNRRYLGGLGGVATA